MDNRILKQGQRIQNKKSGNYFYVNNILTGNPESNNFKPIITYHIKQVRKSRFLYLTQSDLNIIEG